MLRSVLVLALAVLTSPADAQMYRYRDPETGQTKLTNIPPPGTKQSAPAQALPTPGAGQPAPAAAAKPAATLPSHAFETDRQRARLLQQLVAEAPNVGTPRARSGSSRGSATS